MGTGDVWGSGRMIRRREEHRSVSRPVLQVGNKDLITSLKINAHVKNILSYPVGIVVPSLLLSSR